MFMPPSLRGHQHGQAGGAVDDDAEVELAGDVAAGFDEDAATVWPSGPVWIVTSLLLEQVLGNRGGFVGGLHELDAVLLRVVFDRALAAAAGVDLGLHDGERAAQLLERGGGFVGGRGHDALRHGDAGVAEELLALVFVDFHWTRDRAALDSVLADGSAESDREECET